MGSKGPSALGGSRAEPWPSFLSMLSALVLLLACQLAGEAAARADRLPVPGPVLGMALLFGLLVLRPHAACRPPTVPRWRAWWPALLGNLSLLFVPAGVGVVQQGPVLLRNGPGLLVALVVSTALALAVTGGCSSRWRGRCGDERRGCGCTSPPVRCCG